MPHEEPPAQSPASPPQGEPPAPPSQAEDIAHPLADPIPDASTPNGTPPSPEEAVRDGAMAYMLRQHRDLERLQTEVDTLRKLVVVLGAGLVLIGLAVVLREMSAPVPKVSS